MPNRALSRIKGNLYAQTSCIARGLYFFCVFHTKGELDYRDARTFSRISIQDAFAIDSADQRRRMSRYSVGGTESSLVSPWHLATESRRPAWRRLRKCIGYLPCRWSSQGGRFEFFRGNDLRVTGASDSPLSCWRELFSEPHIKLRDRTGHFIDHAAILSQLSLHIRAKRKARAASQALQASQAI